MILSVCSQKGGTSKTTTSINLAAYAAHQGRRVLLIDLDPQANSSKVLIPDYEKVRVEDSVYSTIIRQKPLPIFPSTVKGLHITPSHVLLAKADWELIPAPDHKEERLKRGYLPYEKDYDVVIIDTPPQLSWLTFNALAFSDKVLIPISPGFFELDSVVQISDTINDAKTYWNPNLKLAGFVFVMSDSTISSRESLKLLRQAYTNRVCKTVIPRAVAARDASFAHKDIFSHDSNSIVAKCYADLAKEIGL